MMGLRASISPNSEPLGIVGVNSCVWFERSVNMSQLPKCLLLSFSLSLLLMPAFSHAAEGPPLGNLAQYPPERVLLTVTTGDDGGPDLAPSEIVLNSGQYYRLTIDCPDVAGDLSGWRVEMPEFLNNAHLRLVTVGDIEVHLQGLSFNAIECDEVGSAHVSFVPIKPGTYPAVRRQCTARGGQANW